MDESAPYVLDKLNEDRRSKFDNNLAKVIACSLEKYVQNRYQSVDEMHEAIYSCLIDRGEATYRFGSAANFPCDCLRFYPAFLESLNCMGR